jgi:hypothetical protein
MRVAALDCLLGLETPIRFLKRNGEIAVLGR